MKTILKVLVLDDLPNAAKESIENSLRPILIEADSDFGRGIWGAAIGGLSFTVKCDFEKEIANARELLFNSEKSHEYHLILLDNDWGDGGAKNDGLRLLADMFKAGIRHSYLAIYTQAESYEPKYIAEALNFGARALIHKKEGTHFINVLLAALNEAQLKQQISTLNERVGQFEKKDGDYANALIHVAPQLKTKSQAMKDCLADAARYAMLPDTKIKSRIEDETSAHVADTARYTITPGIPVILVGPTGSGKEVLARAMHALSPRKAGVFEVLDCTTVTRELAESILFGHEKGAFTGAYAPSKGAFELANNGTLFIDEVDALSLDLQAKLLRVSESGVYQKLGGRKQYSNCHLIVATNKDLPQLVKEGKFRDDLYSRLSAGVIKIPSLKERREDLPDLAEYFLKEFSERYDQPKIGLTDEAKSALQHHDWKLNIRELKNTMIRTALKRSSDIIKEIAFDYSFVEEPLIRPALRKSVLTTLIANAPRQGSQRNILNLLLANYPDWVSYGELHKALDQNAEQDKASPLLMTKISQLKSFLDGYSLTVERDESRSPSLGYRMKERELE